MSGPVPIVQMYGVTMEGNSVLCHIHGFVPYFFVPAPKGFEHSHCKSFQDALNRAVLDDMRSNKDNVVDVSSVVITTHFTVNIVNIIHLFSKNSCKIFSDPNFFLSNTLIKRELCLSVALCTALSRHVIVQ